MIWIRWRLGSSRHPVVFQVANSIHCGGSPLKPSPLFRETRAATARAGRSFEQKFAQTGPDALLKSGPLGRLLGRASIPRCQNSWLAHRASESMIMRDVILQVQDATSESFPDGRPQHATNDMLGSPNITTSAKIRRARSPRSSPWYS